MRSESYVFAIGSQPQTITPGVRSIPFGKQHALRVLLCALFLYFFLLTFDWLLVSSGLPTDLALAVVHLSGALSLLVFWKYGRWGRAKFDSFGSALLLIGAAFRIQAMIDALIYGNRIDEIARYPNVPIRDSIYALFAKGEFITVTGLLLIGCTWRFFIGKDIEKYSFLHGNQKIPRRTMDFLYGAAIFVIFLRKVVEVSFGPFEQVSLLLYIAGIAAIYYISSRRSTTARQLAAALILALPLSILALNGGMKEEIFFPFVPMALIYWTRYRYSLARVLAVSVFVIVLAISQLYVHHVRAMSWRSTGDLDIPTRVLIGSFIDNIGSIDPMDALNQISSRVNMTAAHAITVSLADHYGYRSVEVFGLIPASLVPRVLWPGKPILQPGALHTARILGVTDPISEIRSASAAGFSTELYLGGGWVGLILGAIVYAWLLAKTQKWCLRFSPGFGHQILSFITLYWTIRFDEKHIVYAYTSIIFTVIFIWFAHTIVRLLGMKSADKNI